MKRRNIAFAALVASLLLSACATNKTAVTEGAAVEGYRYAVLDTSGDYSASPLLMDAHSNLVAALNSTRLTLISDNLVEEMPLDQKAQVLRVSITVTQTQKEAIARLDFADYGTGELIAFCRGVSNIGLTLEQDMQAATKWAIARVRELFGD